MCLGQAVLKEERASEIHLKGRWSTAPLQRGAHLCFPPCLHSPHSVCLRWNGFTTNVSVFPLDPEGKGQGSAPTVRLLRPWDHGALHVCITFNQTPLNPCGFILPKGWCKSREGLTHRLLVVKYKVWEHGWDGGGVNCGDALASFQGQQLRVCALGWSRPEAALGTYLVFLCTVLLFHAAASSCPSRVSAGDCHGKWCLGLTHRCFSLTLPRKASCAPCPFLRSGRGEGLLLLSWEWWSCK